MADESNPDLSNEETPFSSPINEDKHSFEPTKFSTDENDHNDLHIEPIQNGDHQENPSNIRTVEPNENHFNETEFIQETTTNHQEPTSPSHIQPINFSDEQDSSHSNQNSLEESNTDITLPTQTDLQEKLEELKPQRELDEDDIPPPESTVDETPIHDQIPNSSPESERHITDDRPLTELETPYEHHHENEFLPVESSTNETENELSEENPLKNATLSSFLPDLVTETLEQNQDDVIPERNELEKPSMEENLVQNEIHFTEDDFPPLPPASIPVQQILNEQDFPPLPSASVILEEEKSFLSSVLPEPEDVLGNKTLFKQTIVKGVLNSRPTRSTMVTISYTLSLVDNLTSNIRVIENVSNERFFVSECDLIPAIDICVQLMDRGERALINSDIRHCYGDMGSEEKQIPSISSLNSYKMKIDLELHDWIPPANVQLLSIDERLYWGEKKRQMGNFYYRRQDYQTSLQCYRGALRFLDTDDNPLRVSFDENQRSILNEQYIQVQNNVAQVNLLLNKYEACLIAVENVLKYDQKNLKALFRQGKALFQLGKYDQAIQPLKLFIQIQKGLSNTGSDYEKANEMISISENKLANYHKDEKEIYRRMFQSTTTTNSTLHQQRQTKNNNQIDNTNNNWWPYIALGSAVLATIGLVTFIKYRKVS